MVHANFITKCGLLLQPAGVEDFGGNETLGKLYLRRAGLFTEDYWYWIGIGVLLGYALLFNTLFTLALTYLNRKSH